LFAKHSSTFISNLFQFSRVARVAREIKTISRLDINKNKYPNTLFKEKQLPDLLDKALIGILLGDGHLEKSSYGLNANARIRLTFAGKYKPLALYIAALFSNFITSKGLVFSKIKFNGSTGYEKKEFDRISITSIASPIFTKYHNIFYKSMLALNKF